MAKVTLLFAFPPAVFESFLVITYLCQSLVIVSLVFILILSKLIGLWRHLVEVSVSLMANELSFSHVLIS